MPTPSSRLPSLTALRTFEAVARHKSMTRAARELFVTHSAVSRQVQSLEKTLGVTLLRRLPRHVEPTSEGGKLADTLTDAFGLIEKGVAQVQPGALSVRCPPSLMKSWLIPRLHRLKASAPQTEISLSIANGAMNLARDGVDIAINNDKNVPDDNIIVKHLMPEMVGPVCSPDYAAAHNLRDIYDLRQVKILANRSRIDAWAEWQSLIAWQELPLVESELHEHLFLVLELAVRGLGVAMAPRHLVAEDLATGRLIAPFGFKTNRYNLVLWMTQQARKREDALAFARWLRAEAQQTIASWSSK